MLIETIMLYNLNSAMCQLYLNKTGEQKLGIWKTGRESNIYLAFTACQTWTEYFTYIILFNFHNDPLKKISDMLSAIEESDTQGGLMIRQ